MFHAFTSLTDEDATFKHNRKWYHESLAGNDTLVITAGDSWTWGDSLHGIDPPQFPHEVGGAVDDPKRVTSIYGSILARKLNADFVNIAFCGGSNKWIIDTVDQFLSQLKIPYKKIHVVITLTENCRDLNTDIEDLPKYPGSPYVPQSSNELNLNKFFEQYETNMFLHIQELMKKHNTINFLIGRNFTYSYDINKPLLNNTHLSKTWVDCLAENQTHFMRYPKNLRLLSIIAYYPLEQHFINDPLYKEQIMPFSDDSLLAIEWLSNSVLNYKKATKHPTELGHEIWAEYLYNTINQKNMQE